MSSNDKCWHFYVFLALRDVENDPVIVDHLFAEIFPIIKLILLYRIRV